jgi:hypothetical protein
MTSTQLKAQIDSQITNETQPGSITPIDIGTNIKAVVDYVDQDRRAYKIYSAIFNQSLSNAPVMTVLENTVGSVVWTRSQTGLYTGRLTGAFPLGKVSVILSQGSGTSRLAGHSPDANVVQIASMGAYANEFVDNSINQATIEIKVYY